MRFDLTVNEFSIDLLFKKTLEVYDAETWRPYFHTKDFANTILRIIDIDKKLLKNEIFNVGVDDNNATKNDILRIIGDFVDISKVKILAKGSASEHQDQVRKCIDYIFQGEIFQANLSRLWKFECQDN